MTTKSPKILGRVKTCALVRYLPGSHFTPNDQPAGPMVTKLCLEATTDPHHRVIVTEKLDGACVGVALVNGRLHTLTRYGHACLDSPFRNHHLFHQWAMANEDRFRAVLKEGERLVGDWLAQALGTRYDLFSPDFESQPFEPFVAFDLIKRYRRLNYDDFRQLMHAFFNVPHLLHDGDSLPIGLALDKHAARRYPGESIHGVIYRVQRKKKVAHLCKYVVPTNDHGKYLPSVTGKEEVWNWQPGKVK